MYVFAYALVHYRHVSMYVYVRVYFHLTAGGGPSSSPIFFTQEQLDLVRKVANCKNLEEFYSLTDDKRTALACHLANVPFEKQEVDGVHAVVFALQTKTALLEAGCVACACRGAAMNETMRTTSGSS